MNIEIKDFRFDGRRIEVILNVPSSCNGLTDQGGGKYKAVIITFGFIESFGADDWRIIDINGHQKYTGTPYDVPSNVRPICSSEEQVKKVFNENVTGFVATFLSMVFENIGFSILRLNKDDVPVVRNCYWDADDYREGWATHGVKPSRSLAKKFFIDREIFSRLESNDEHLYVEPMIPKVISPISSILPKSANIYTMSELEEYCTVPVFNVINLNNSKVKQ